MPKQVQTTATIKQLDNVVYVLTTGGNVDAAVVDVVVVVVVVVGLSVVLISKYSFGIGDNPIIQK